MDFFQNLCIAIREFSIYIISINILSYEINKLNQEFTKKLNNMIIYCRNREYKMVGIIHEVRVEKMKNLGVEFMPLK